MKNKNILGSLLLVLTAAIWGTAFVAQRAGMDLIEPFTFNAARLILAAVAVGVVAAVRGEKTDIEISEYRRNTVTGGVLCGLCLAGATNFQQVGLVYTTAGKAGFITALYMLLVPVINFILFRKKTTWIVWLAVLVGLTGMYLLCVNEGFSLSKGDALVMVCAVLFSFHILFCDHYVQRGNPIGMSAIQFLVAAVISSILALVTEEPSWEKLSSAIVPIAYCGLMSGGVGYTLQIVAQKFTEPTVASILMSLESVFAATAGALILHERMSLKETVGCIVMFIAVLMVQIPVKKEE